MTSFDPGVAMLACELHRVEAALDHFQLRRSAYAFPLGNPNIAFLDGVALHLIGRRDELRDRLAQVMG